MKFIAPFYTYRIVIQSVGSAIARANIAGERDGLLYRMSSIAMFIGLMTMTFMIGSSQGAKCGDSERIYWLEDEENCHLFFICQPLGNRQYKKHTMTCGALYWHQEWYTCTDVPVVGKKCGPIVKYNGANTPSDACPYVADVQDPRYFFVRGKPSLRQHCVFGMEFAGNSVCTCISLPLDVQEGRASKWLVDYNAQMQRYLYESALAGWNYSTNLTEHNQQMSLQANVRYAAFVKSAGKEASNIKWKWFRDPLMKRQFLFITKLGLAVLPDGDFKKANRIQTDLVRTYSTAKVCNKPGDASGNCYSLDPDLKAVMSKSTDPNLLLWAWKGWRDATGAKMPDAYKQYIDIINKAAKLNGHSDHGKALKSSYEEDARLYDSDYDFEADVERLWLELRPLYQQLHAYARRRLKQRYPQIAFPTSGHIPAHLLGDMWAQRWFGLTSLLMPFPDKVGIDVTNEMVRQKYDPIRMLKTAEEFFTSLGLLEMPAEFWEHSMFTKPTDRDVVCHPSAWTFFNQKDFRLRQCLEVTMYDLLVIHHEMGHIQYFMQYKHQPINFRQGANPGFHEALGDVLGLSVSTPEHLQKIGLLKNYKPDIKVELNFLMSQSKSIAFLPFGYLIDKWRWDVYSGNTTRNNYNTKWWDARCHYQGVSPPIARDSSRDFDPGAKFHIPSDVPYIRYFISHILQFQFYKVLCDAAKHSGPLHKCDIYQSLEAGKLLGDMMKLGASKPWPEALESITGSRVMSAKPLMEYFEPLRKWLKEENKGEPIGWEENCPPGSFISS